MLTPNLLHDYQKRAVNHQCVRPHSMLWLDMGLGKTIVTLTSIAHLIGTGFLRGVVIVAPIRVIRLVWRQEAMKWEHTKHLKFSMVTGTKDQRTRALLRPADIYLINYENLEWLAQVLDTYFIAKGKPMPFNGIVWDEISKMKNSTTNRVKATKKVLSHFDWLTGLTGTPASNGYKDLHGQFLVVDKGQRLGISKTAFRTRFYKKAGPYKEVPYPDTEETIKNLIGDITLEMSAEDYNKLPDMIVNEVEVEMPDEVRAKYDQMEREFFTVLDSGKEVEVFNSAALTNKCLAEGTDVMTTRGWVPIEALTKFDLVWDGVEWVSISGVVYNGVRRVVDLWGVRMTPDHQVLTLRGWKEAQEVINGEPGEGLDRTAVWSPFGDLPRRQQEDQRVIRSRYMASSMRLWNRGSSARAESQVEASTKAQVVRMSSRGDDSPTWNDEHSSVGDLAQHAVTVHGPIRQRLAKLWWAWHHGLSTVGRVVRGVLGRHESWLSTSSDNRTQRRQQRIQQRELQMGVSPQTGEQHTQQCDHFDANRADYGSAGSSSLRPTPDHHLSTNPPRMVGRQVDCARVYDVINAGPRQRFTVRGVNGEVFLAHNCLQFSNGAVYPVAGMPLWEPVHDAKLDALEEILDEAQGSPVLCAYAYRSDAERIMLRFKDLAPINLTDCKSEGSLTAAMERWQRGECALMIGHPASMGHGIDGLQKAGRTLVWFGLNWSLDLYDQFNARVRRQGQGASVVCHRIMCRDTLDQAQALALNDKATTQAGLRAAVKQYRKQRGV